MNALPKSSFTCSIIMPAFNEEKALEGAAAEAIDILRGHPRVSSFEMLVIDDGSRDRTLQIAGKLAQRYPEIRVLTHGRNLGFGAAVRTGFRAARNDYLLLVPGDGENTRGCVELLLDHAGEADLIIGYTLNQKDRPFYRWIFSWLYTTILNHIFWLKLPYYNGPVVYRRNRIRPEQIRTDGFAYQLELLIPMLKRGTSYRMVGIRINEQASKQSSAFRFKNLRQTAWAVARLVYLRLMGNLKKG
jgi:glycosyltransferase involved in cell wall biosynthesis